MKAITRVKSEWRVAIAAFTLGCVLFWATPMGVEDPVFEGRKVSSWFKDLCSGVFGGTPKATNFQAAHSAFSRMGPEAVPFLTNQLRYGRSGRLEHVLLRLKNSRFTAPMVSSVVFPSERRGYATAALREMRGSAQTAIPGLLESWARDTKDVKVGAVAALAGILYGKAPEDVEGADAWKAYESRVLFDAARRAPGAAKALGISPNVLAEQIAPPEPPLSVSGSITPVHRPLDSLPAPGCGGGR